jgi:hypothetical protein
VAGLLRVSRESLGVVAGSRGLVYGDLRIRLRPSRAAHDHADGAADLAGGGGGGGVGVVDDEDDDGWLDCSGTPQLISVQLTPAHVQFKSNAQYIIGTAAALAAQQR